ncbi:Nramp family divalent metal transporter [Pedobacter sp.]|jgi:manganese transport protein|uniref:Nramp family divalent metal transporter n=1 Tax=Pedobacter sp. TaxID=1411316 RepID=UPI002CBE4874|nr:Nramp family divalent metal transporter [Pedobacter sp.]HEV3222386.1 Nramp family divalent metal transporter [Puia sp.]HWW39251.1 Nramp family divalent metal transporter [Pedobacter sp.]
MKQTQFSDLSLSEVHGSIDVNPSGPRWRQIFSFFGPAYLVSVGYMDPGNWATDIAGGSHFGYRLLWVLLMSNLMALVLQGLSARLGIVRGRDLAQANREAYPRLVNFCLYILAEIAITACDLAEVLGMAIGIQLLTGLPLIYGVGITALDTFLLLFLQRLGMRKLEVFILSLIAIVGISFFIEIFLAKPSLSEISRGLIPSLPGATALYVAIGIIGATVMPHNLYLHSALVQTRKIYRDELHIKKAINLNLWDSAIALNLAFLVNAAILILAGAVFFKSGRTEIASITEAHKLLTPLLGSRIASILFAIALIAAGQSSTITGTLAGQIVMEGYLHLRINPLLRRMITRMLAIIPAVLVIGLSGEGRVDQLLVLSQVILSLQLGFAVIPLIHFVSDKKKMGVFQIKKITMFVSWSIAILLLYLNLKLVLEEGMQFLNLPGLLFWKIFSAVVLIGAIFLLLYILIHPWLSKTVVKDVTVHGEGNAITKLEIPKFRNIAVALDFSRLDEKLLAFAIGQGGTESNYILIHVVESASARMLGRQSDDLETRTDQERLNSYQLSLEKNNYKAVTRLGYIHRTKEIVRIVKEEGAEILVIGAHGHTGLKDFIYGETVNTVRHELKIPVLIVNL